MTRHTVRLLGPAMEGTRVRAHVLRDLLDVLVEGSRKAVRLRVEGRSTAPGSLPSWVTAAASFDVLGFRPGSTCVDLEAQPLHLAASERLAQDDLFIEFDSSRTALQLLTESLRDAVAGNPDSDLYDDGLVGTFGGFSRLLANSSGIEGIELNGGSPQLHVTRAGLARARELRRQTPPSQTVRVAGRLDAIRHSDRMFTLVLASGETLRGVAAQVAPDQLVRLFGREALVGGTAIFRPSGRVRRLEAHWVEPVNGSAALWQKAPRPLAAPLDPRTLRMPQGPRSGLNAIFGAWPGDESDESIAAALQELA